MKKHFLNFALMAMIIGSITAGCGSQKAASDSSDSTQVSTDSATMSTPATTDSVTTRPADTTRADSANTPKM